MPRQKGIDIIPDGGGENREKQRRRSPGGKRMVLSEHVPLQAPLNIRIEPCQVCNFRCEYCPVSLDSFRKGYIKAPYMDFSLFQNTVLNIQQSFGKVKRMMLVGMGESLLHPRIADMVSYITECGICDGIEIVTNGALLTPKISEALTSAGLSLLRISVNGLSDDDFQKHCGVHVSFSEYVENIRYLYEHRKNTQIYVKILNYMVKHKEQYDRFFDTFEPISDMISIENLIEGMEEIDYHEIAGEGISFDSTQSNTSLVDTKICSMPFYTLQINADGTVYPCCTFGVSSIGDIQKDSLKNIWQNQARWFQRQMLEGVHSIPCCKDCKSMPYRVYPEDAMDAMVEEIKKRYDK